MPGAAACAAACPNGASYQRGFEFKQPLMIDRGAGAV
jgi:coenzyme F420-reducing hydrogenase gamma subunit